jgi:hypothetical protein
MWPLLVMLSLGIPVWLTLIGYLHKMHNYSSPAVCNYGGDTSCPVTISILQNFIPEVIPSQKCDMNMGQILQLHSYGCVLLQFWCTREREWMCSSRSLLTSSALRITECNQKNAIYMNIVHSFCNAKSLDVFYVNLPDVLQASLSSLYIIYCKW